MIFMAGDLLAVMSPPHHCSSRRGSHGRIARAGCHKATRMLCGMRSDGLQANVTLYLASPERVDSQEIEDGRRHGSERTCDLHNSPATTHRPFWGYLATNTHMSESTRDATGVSFALSNSFFALSSEILSRYMYRLHVRPENELLYHDSEAQRYSAERAWSCSTDCTVQAQKLINAFVLLRWRRISSYIRCVVATVISGQ